MSYTGIGVHIPPSLVEEIVEGRINSIVVHVVPGRDDEVASVVEAKLAQGSCDLLLVRMPGSL